MYVSGPPGLTGFPGRPGPPGRPVGSNIPGPVGDPGLPGLDGEYGKYISSLHFLFLFPSLPSPFLLLNLSSLLQVFKVLQVPPGHLVQGQSRETEVTPGSQASLAPPAGKENQEAMEAPDSPAAQG